MTTDSNATPKRDIPEQPSSGDMELLRDQQQLSLAREFALFLRDNKKWWLVPILLVLGLVTALVSLTSTGAAPFIYSLF